MLKEFISIASGRLHPHLPVLPHPLFSPLPPPLRLPAFLSSLNANSRTLWDLGYFLSPENREFSRSLTTGTVQLLLRVSTLITVENSVRAVQTDRGGVSWLQPMSVEARGE